MGNLFHTIFHRTFGAGIPGQEEIERFGADGEEAICRILCENFDCVIRNAVVPHKSLFLEKDFLVIHRGAPFVIEVKNWKGDIGMEGDTFFQNKENGVHKTLKSPVGTTKQFINRMKDFYGISRFVYGIVVFAEPDCTLYLPEESEGVALLTVKELVPYIKSRAKAEEKGQEPLDGDRILRCTRFYEGGREFCKGILADAELECYRDDGALVRIDTTGLRYLSVERQRFRLRDKLYVTYKNGSTGVFFNRDTVLTVGCLDGSYRKISLNRVEHIVF